MQILFYVDRKAKMPKEILKKTNNDKIQYDITSFFLSCKSQEAVLCMFNITLIVSQQQLYLLT